MPRKCTAGDEFRDTFACVRVRRRSEQALVELRTFRPCGDGGCCRPMDVLIKVGEASQARIESERESKH
jgi:hypothetical protein